MRTVVLHLGMHKTGSSSIQATLDAAPVTSQMRYGQLPTRNHSGIFLRAFSANPDKTVGAIRRAGKSRDEAMEQGVHSKEMLRSELAQDSDVVVFSGENILRLRGAELTELVNLLRESGREVKVVAYVRSPQGYMESALQEQVKRNLRDFEPDKLYPDYRGRFEKFENAFGAAAMHYWLFDPASFPDRCVVRDFCTRLNLPVAPEQILRTNEGLSSRAVKLLYALRKFGPRDEDTEPGHKANALLVESLQQLLGPKLRLSPSLVRDVLDRKADDLAWMQQRVASPIPVAVPDDETGTVGDESDLLRFDDETIGWVATQVGVKPPAAAAMTPTLMATWVSVLRNKFAVAAGIELPQHEGAAAPRAIQAGTLRRFVRKELDTELTPPQASRLLTDFFQTVQSRLSNAGVAEFHVPQLGTFKRVEGGAMLTFTPESPDQ